MADEPLRAFFGERLARLRLARNLTQRDLARDMKIDVAVVSRIERGKTDPKLSTIAALARVLDLRVVDLVGEDEPPAIETELARLRADLDEVGSIAREALRVARESRAEN